MPAFKRRVIVFQFNRQLPQQGGQIYFVHKRDEKCNG